MSSSIWVKSEMANQSHKATGTIEGSARAADKSKEGNAPWPEGESEGDNCIERGEVRFL